MKTPPLARLLLFGFLFLFAFAATYLLLDSTGAWTKIPATLARGLEIFSGLVLFGALIAHLALASGRLPADTVGRRS
jgi:hypothetical protein